MKNSLLLSVFLAVVFVVGNVFSQHKDGFDFEKFHKENLPVGISEKDNPPPQMDFTNSNYSLYQNYYAGVNYGSVNPTRDTGTGIFGTATRVRVSMTGDGTFYPHIGLLLPLPNTYSVRPVSAGIRILYPLGTNGLNDIPIKMVLGVRNDVGGADTMISSTTPQTVQGLNGIMWQVVQATLGNPAGGAWKQWINAMHAGQAFIGTKIFQYYMIGWVVMPNGDTIWTDLGNGIWNVPPLTQGPFYPTLGAVGVPINPLCFNWGNVSGIRYQLQVSTDQFFPSWAIVFNQIVDNPPVCVYGLITGQTYYWRVSNSFEPNGPFGGWVTLYFTAGQFVGIEPGSNKTPDKFALYQNYPNPFNPVTTVKFDLPKEGNVKLVVYDLNGKEVVTLVNDVLKAGVYNISFDGANLSTGVYMYSLKTGDFMDTKKMTLIK